MSSPSSHNNSRALILPMQGLSPRRLRKKAAAHYMGVSDSTFRKRVEEGIYPPGRTEVGAKFWLREDLDKYIDRQFGITSLDGAAAASEDPFVARFRKVG